MLRFRARTRVVALLLLLFAAGDLLIAGACEDGANLTVTASAFSSGDVGNEAGHTGEECYCCSRTVQPESSQNVVPIRGVVERRADNVRRCPQSPSSVPYHPPLS
jgi:hypothetical protein